MKPLLAAAVIAAALLIAPAAGADTARSSAFACDGFYCAYIATGLTPGADYDLSIGFQAAGATGPGSGCHAGAYINADDTGAVLVLVREALIECLRAPLVAGEVRAWLHPGETSWYSPPIDGTLIDVPIVP